MRPASRWRSAFGAIAQAWEDSSPVIVIAEGVGAGATRHTHFDMAGAFRGRPRGLDLVPHARAHR
jgi:hypothetical protein